MHIRRTPFIAALLALSSLGIAGCAQRSDLEQLNQNQFVLRGMIANDRQQLDAVQQQVRQLKGQLAEYQHGGAASGGSSDQLASINDRLSKLESNVSALQAGMVAAPAAPAVGATPGTGASSPDTGTAPAASSAPSSTPEPKATWPDELDQEISNAESSKEPGVKLYRAGLKAMKDGKYPLAITNFTKLQHQYPKSALVEPAEYFSANALYETGKYDNAILQFNDLVMRYPKGRFASQSLLREASAFLKTNDRIDARLTLKKLLSDHSGTPEATAADAMMKSLASN